MNNLPKISFVFPIRWIIDEEDKKFTGSNLQRKVEKIWGKENMNLLKRVVTYSVVVTVQAYKPTRLPLSATTMSKYLKSVFPNGKCLDFEVLYKQNRSQTSLPTLNIEIYF